MKFINKFKSIDYNRRTALVSLCAKAIVVAFAVAGPGLAGATNFTCYWVGPVYRASLGNGEYDPAFYTWGDARGWSMFSSGGGGTCPGGTPNNDGLQYDVVIANASASAMMANLGQRSMVQVVKTGQVISPTVSKLTLSNSYLGLTGGTLTSATLAADGSRIVGASVVVNGSQGDSLLNDMTIASTALSFSGADSSALITGTFALARNKTASGRSGTVLWGVAPVLAVSSGASLNFVNATVYGQDSATASLGTIQATSGSLVSFFGGNTVLGATLQGAFVAQPGSSTKFQQTINQGTLTASNLSAITFNNGHMTQLAGAAAPGFAQTGTGSISILDLSASAGYFSGIIHIGGDGLGGGPFDNTLAGVSVKPGATLLFDSGSTSFSGSNRGTLSVQRATLQLAGSSTNDLGTLDNLAGGKVVISGTFANQHGSSLNNSGAMVIEKGAILNNSGSLSNLAHGVASNLGTINNSGVLDNALGAILTNDGHMTNQGSLIDAGIINGTGTFKQSAGSSQIDGLLKQASITIGGGALFGNGVVTGPTTIEAGLVQGSSPGASGTPGTLSIKGRFILGSGGTLQELINSSVSFSSLNVTGDVSLDGTLNIVTDSGFSFIVGQSYDIMNFTRGGLVGRFSHLRYGSFRGSGNFINIGGGQVLDVTYNNTLGEVQLSVATAAPVPEPAESTLILTGLGLMGWLARRKKIASTAAY